MKKITKLLITILAVPAVSAGHLPYATGFLGCMKSSSAYDKNPQLPERVIKIQKEEKLEDILAKRKKALKHRVAISVSESKNATGSNDATKSNIVTTKSEMTKAELVQAQSPFEAELISMFIDSSEETEKEIALMRQLERKKKNGKTGRK